MGECAVGTLLQETVNDFAYPVACTPEFYIADSGPIIWHHDYTDVTPNQDTGWDPDMEGYYYFNNIPCEPGYYNDGTTCSDASGIGDDNTASSGIEDVCDTAKGYTSEFLDQTLSYPEN